MDNRKKQTGRANYVRGLAAIYLLFLAYRMLRDAVKGQTDMPVVSIVGGLVFAAVAGVLFYGEWKAYRFAKEHKDDPESWNDDPDMLEAAEEEPEEAPEPDEDTDEKPEEAP